MARRRTRLGPDLRADERGPYEARARAYAPQILAHPAGSRGWNCITVPTLLGSRERCSRRSGPVSMPESTRTGDPGTADPKMTEYVSLRGVPPPNPPMVEQFIAAGLEPIEYAGVVVHPHHWLDLEEGDVIRLEWLGSRSPRAQGLVLR